MPLSKLPMNSCVDHSLSIRSGAGGCLRASSSRCNPTGNAERYDVPGTIFSCARCSFGVHAHMRAPTERQHHRSFSGEATVGLRTDGPPRDDAKITLCLAFLRQVARRRDDTETPAADSTTTHVPLKSGDGDDETSSWSQNSARIDQESSRNGAKNEGELPSVFQNSFCAVLCLLTTQSTDRIQLITFFATYTNCTRTAH